MDEEQAAAYYDEMRRKGGGAAKLKQGLGYGSSSSQPSSQGSFLNFVRGDSHEESLAKLEKESRLAAVRDKLKRRSAKNEGSDDDSRRNSKHSSRSPSRKYVGGARSRSQSRDREHSSRSERSHRRERRSGSSSSHEADRRRRPRSPGTSDSRSSSGSPSHERRSHRSERKKQEKTPRAGRRSRSPRRSSKRPRSVSSADHHRHAHRDLGRDSHSRRSPSSFIERSQRKSESRKEDKRDARKPNALDYAKLIPGFDDMTPAEKVREKMKLQLSDTVSKDTEKGMDTEWERFVFNKNAPLDDDAKLDYFGDGTGARDDTGFLQNTGSTFLSANTSQAKREAQIQAAHDAAIFGPPDAGLSSEKVGTSANEFKGSWLREAAVDNETAVQLEGTPSISNLLSDQVSAFQQGSWRERALKLKQQKTGNTLT